MEQEVRFCTSADGVRIAYSTVGNGKPLVVVPAWVSHLEFEWQWAKARRFWQELAKKRLIIRFDHRGMGLSDRDVPDLSTEARLADLEAVIEALRLENFDFLGMSQGVGICVLYAVEHPHRVDKFVAYGSQVQLRASRNVAEAMLALVRTEWGLGSAALGAAFLPDGEPEDVAAFSQLSRVAADAETAARLLEEIMSMDVTPVLPEVRVPTLVLHRRKDRIHPLDVAREIAALIPDAQLKVLEGKIFYPWLGDTDAVLDAILPFLGEEFERPETHTTQGGLLIVLFTDMESSTAITQRLGDAKSQDVRRAHNTIVRDALKNHSGKEIKHTGDGIMASFTTASTALGCAVAIQQGVAAHKDEHPDSPLGVYIGLNAGEPIAEEQDLFGTSVDLAARICDRAKPGQILASDVVRQLAAGKDFLFADLGETELRGFEDPVKLWEVSWRETV